MYKGKNRYYKFSRISEARFRRLIKCFALDLTVMETARLTGISVRSVNEIFLKVRRRISGYCEAQSPYCGESELDESCFGPRRVRGKRGRGAGSKTIVFGIFKRNGQVCTEIVPDAKKKTLLAVLRGRVSLGSVIHTDGWRGYNGLVDAGYLKHFRVRHGANEFAHDGQCHINGIESFWSYTKRRLTKFNGVKANFELHLKKCEWRWKREADELSTELWKLLLKIPGTASPDVS